jgi:hypothetical protein
LVQPFVEHSQAAARDKAEIGEVGGSDRFRGWIWEPHLEEDWGIDEDEADEAEEADETGDEDEDSEADQDGGDGSTGRERQREAENFDGFWDTNRVRRIIYRETEVRIGVKIRVAL